MTDTETLLRTTFRAVAATVSESDFDHVHPCLHRRSRVARPHWTMITAAAAAVGIVTAVIAGGAFTHTQSAAAAPVQFSHQGESIIATLTDPYASADHIRRAFTAQHLNVNLRVIPVSPSFVGTIVDSGGLDGIGLVEDPHCTTPGGGHCIVGLRIPNGYTGHASLALGRPARPGESYVSTNDAFVRGEQLHCSGLLGATAAAARSYASAHGLNAEWSVDGKRVPPADVRDSYHVMDGIPLAPDQVLLDVDPTLLPSTTAMRQASTGC